MNIAVVGGTGALGQRIIQNLTSLGHRIRALSRRSPEHPVDLTTGEGLRNALRGCDVVVDASNNLSRHAEKTFVQGSRRLLAAEKIAGVRHHVCVFIVGIEKASVGYYGVKWAQERVVEEGPIPWTIVRSTQFHEFCQNLFATAARWRVLPVPRALVQTVAIADASNAIAEICESSPFLSRVNVAGPAWRGRHLRKSESRANTDANQRAVNEEDRSWPHVLLIHVHICPTCGRASRREDPDGTPDAAGVFHCSRCENQGPLNEAVIEETDERLHR